MKRLILCILCILAAVQALAQAPQGARRIILNTEYATQREALDAVVTSILPDLNVTPSWIDKDYYLVRTDAAPIDNINGQISYFIQIRQADAVTVEITGSYAVAGAVPAPVQNGGQAGSIKAKTWAALEGFAAGFPGSVAGYK